MERVTLSDWFQGLSAIAILIGLGFVLLELRQSREIAQAQVFGENNTATMQIMETIMGEDSAVALARACFSPSELSDKDVIVLDQLYALWWLKAARHLSLTQFGDLHRKEDAEQIASFFVRSINGTAHGKWWWENYPNSPRMRELGNRALAGTQYDCAKYMSAFRSLDDPASTY